MVAILLGMLAGVAGAASHATTEPRVRFVREMPGDSTQRDIAANVLPLADGALVTGWTARNGGPAEGLVIRVDGQGNVIWRRELAGDGADLLFAAQPDRDGFVCAGFTTSQGAGASDGWFVRLDASGATTWQWVVGGPGEERLTSLVPTATGWIAAGQQERGGDTDAWVVSLDAQGKEQGQWTWGGPGIQRGLGIVSFPDGGCAITGRMGTSDARETVDGFVARFSANGQERWRRTIGGPGFQVAYHLRPGLDGSLLVTGYGFVSPARDHDGFVLRLGADGRGLRRRDLGGPAYDRATQSVELDDGSTVTVGYTKRADAPEDAPAWQTFLRGLDRKGRPAWTKLLEGEGFEAGRWIAGDASSLWVVSQRTPAGGGSRVVLTRLDRPDRAPARGTR